MAVTVQEAPGAKVEHGLLWLKFAELLTEAKIPLITRFSVPLFDTVNVLVTDAPFATEPKLNDVGLIIMAAPLWLAAWFTVNILPAKMIVPVREVPSVLAVTE